MWPLFHVGTLWKLYPSTWQTQFSWSEIEPTKCSFFPDNVNFLGHVVSGDGVECDPDNIQTIGDWPVPQTVSDVISFLGLAKYYRRFVPNFAQLSALLTYLMKRNQSFQWTIDCDSAFQALKEKLITAPILAYASSGIEHSLLLTLMLVISALGRYCQRKFTTKTW